MNPRRIHTRIFLRLLGFFLRSRQIPSLPVDVSEILVVRQHDQLGDMMCVIPALRCLKYAYPGGRITLIASPVNFDIMRGHPYLDRVLLFDKKAMMRSAGEVVKFYRELRTREYDLAVVPSTVSVSLTSGVLARLSGAKARLGPGSLSGVDNPAKFLFTHAVDLDWSSSPGRHQAMRNIDILRPLGLAGTDIGYVLDLETAEEQAAIDELRKFRTEHPLLIGIHPGAAKSGNRWPWEHFLSLASKLFGEFGNGLVITIGPRDTELYDLLSLRLDVPHTFIRNAPLRHVAAVISTLDFFISNDTGILHIAGALRPMTLGLFGPTNPLHWAPAGRKNHYIASKDDRMSSIGVDEVFEACRIMLRGLKSRRDDAIEY